MLPGEEQERQGWDRPTEGHFPFDEQFLLVYFLKVKKLSRKGDNLWNIRKLFMHAKHRVGSVFLVKNEFGF